MQHANKNHFHIVVSLSFDSYQTIDRNRPLFLATHNLAKRERSIGTENALQSSCQPSRNNRCFLLSVALPTPLKTANDR
jgi:hypothetical protein